MKKIYDISQVHDGKTVRNYLRDSLKFSSRILKNIKYKGGITVNGEDVFADYILRTGNILEVTFPDECSENIEAINIPLDILYEDYDILAVNKPANMPVHPSVRHREDTLANAVMFYYRNIPFTFRVLTRLDIDTTGVVIIAKNALSASRFINCLPEKNYLAVCVGTPEQREGEICAPISRDDGIIKRRVDQGGKYALTRYRVIDIKNELSLVSVMPVTGRTHQIRLHMAHIGCPIYGDFLYGTEIIGQRTRLHCEKVTFLHPSSGVRIHVEAERPEDFKELFV